MITPDFAVKTSDFDESSLMACKDTLSPGEIVGRLSAGKAQAVFEALGGGRENLVIGGDTVVVSPEGEIFGIPRDRDDAFRMLSALSGRTHRVITGITLTNGREETFTSTTFVTFYPLSRGEIEDYLDTDEPYDKAGGYGVQSLGGLFVEKIDGDYYNVVGLPVAKLQRELEKFLNAL